MASERKLGWRLFAALSAAALIATACGGGDESAEGDGGATTGSEADGGSEGAAGAGEGINAEQLTNDVSCDSPSGTLVWAHEQEPPDMHLDDPNNNLTITSHIQQSLLEGLYGITVDTTFFPELLSEELEVTENEDGSVTFSGTLREGLTWSDGTPLTAEHVKGTYDIIMEGVNPETGEGGVFLIGDRVGYDVIDPESWVVDGQNFEFTMSEFFSGYPTIFERLFPTHVIPDAAAANEAFAEWQSPDGSGPLPSSGPMIFENWQRGVNMTLTQNPDYHGSVSPDARNSGPACVEGVQINWVADTDAQINSLKASEADFIYTQPQTQFGDRIAEDENFVVGSSAGPIYEHWGLNTENPHLSDPLVREAMALGMNKAEVMEGLYNPLFGDLLPTEGLGNTYWMSNQPAYQDNQGQAGYGQGKAEEARQKLEEAGYTEGDGGIYEHPERGRLSLRVGTTGGNALRELQQQIIAEQLKTAGFEITIDNVPGADYFSEVPFSEASLACSHSDGAEGDCSVWDITQFAWVGGPWPGSSSASFRSGSGQNPYGYNSDAFDQKANECDLTVDDDERAACYNELDKYVTTLEMEPEQGLFMLPITQKPQFYGFSTQSLESAAVAPDSNDAGPLVNVVDFVKQ